MTASKLLPSSTATQVAVVMVPLPAQGHLNQLLHISRRLASSYNIPVHYVGSATHIHQAKIRAHNTSHSPIKNNNLHFHHFDIPPFESPPPDPNSDSKFPNHLMPVFEASANLRGPVGSLIKSLAETSRRVVVIHDSLMASVVQDVSSVPNAESYIFHSVSAFSVYWYLREAAGKRTPLVEVSDDGGDDGVLRDEHLPTINGCFSAEFLKFIAWQYEFQTLSSGRLYNTCRLVEGPYLKLLEKETTQQNWAVGPFNPVKLQPTIKSPVIGPGRHKCLEWLDHHPPNSVIYVSFGTTTTLNHDQVYALATALENAKHRFIWVLREADKGNIFTGDNPTRGLTDLPEGYEERIDGQGLVVREWVPQLEILGHPSTGGFMSHCGWNSCMESISMGVPLAAWPMHSDQPRNSVLVTKVLRIGTMVREWSGSQGWNEGKVISSVEIERAVRVLMMSVEGDGMRKRAAALGSTVRESVGSGGVSRAELDAFVLHISR